MQLPTWIVYAVICLPLFATAQTKKERKGELYFSWGYNKEWYTHSDVYVRQPSLNTAYTLLNVHSHDHPGWDEGLFSSPISIPQYNYRLGYFFDRENGWGVEINFDHTKHIIRDNQSVRIKGIVAGRVVDSSIRFSEGNGFYYYLNNGANFLLFNLVKRWHWIGDRKSNFVVDALGKAGVGPVIPHVQNSFFGQANDPGFQIGGWNIGAEAGLRATFFKHLFLEYTNKLDYASYSNLKVYNGTASQSFGTYEMILSLGYTIAAGKRKQ
ncbi:hypothetical protein [Sediminibacterium soli]|uniref:hypothetical protein n=1 Tax=Sediminibacterium soli TaxID=2698829 RepID=UPI001379B7AD|nr:hypothetical protein [Sediminibacterium soli]NCI47737.1 hypothetical protein [Sediminibacterium soli]